MLLFSPSSIFPLSWEEAWFSRGSAVGSSWDTFIPTNPNYWVLNKEVLLLRTEASKQMYIPQSLGRQQTRASAPQVTMIPSGH